jgi:hypothetical protein
MGMDYVVEDIPLEANFNIQENPIMDWAMIRKKILFSKANQLLK